MVAITAIAPTLKSALDLVSRLLTYSGSFIDSRAHPPRRRSAEPSAFVNQTIGYQKKIRKASPLNSEKVPEIRSEMDSAGFFARLRRTA